MRKTLTNLLLSVLLLFASPANNAWSQQGSKTFVATDKQNMFARKLQQTMLEIGLSPDVFIHEGQLTIFMSISKSLVYQLITKGNLLQQTYDLGFKGLKFQQSYGQTYIFDLSKGIPQCDVVRKVCL